MDSDDMDALCRGISSSPPEQSSPLLGGQQMLSELSSPSPAPLLSTSSFNPCKQSFQDFTQHANTIFHHLKLPKTDSRELLNFANLGIDEKLISLAGYSLKVLGKQDLVTAPDIVYNLPKIVENIDHYLFVILMEPGIVAYINSKIGLAAALQLLEDNPSWGLTPAVKADKNKFDTIMAYVRDKLTKCRADMKKALIKSMGTEDTMQVADTGDPLPHIRVQNIVELCKELVGIYKHADIMVSVPLCAQVAFLCCVLKHESGANYWDKVDAELKSTQDTLLDKMKQSKFFQKILEADRKTYGQGHLSNVALSVQSQLPTESPTTSANSKSSGNS